MLCGSVASGSSLKYGCFRACRAVMRLSGSYVRRPFNRLKPVLLSFGYFCSAAACKLIWVMQRMITHHRGTGCNRAQSQWFKHIAISLESKLVCIWLVHVN